MSGPKTRAARWLCLLCLTLCAALLLALCACQPPSNSKVRVIGSSFGSYSIAKMVAGDHAVVNLMSTQDADPHGYELDSFAIANLGHADLLLTMGQDIDEWLPDSQKSIDRAGTIVLDLSASGDAHRLLLPGEAAAFALEVGEQLGQLDEDHREDYASAAQTLFEAFEALDVRLRDAVASMPALAVFGANPFDCAKEALGVTLVAVRQSCDQEDVVWEKEDMDAAREAGAAVLLYTERDDGIQALALAQELEVPAVLWHTLHMLPKQQREQGATALTLLEQTVTALENEQEE